MKTNELLDWIRDLILSNNIKAFYNSALWLKKRMEILKAQNHECQRCKSRGVYTKAVTVHHRKYLRKHPELALTDSNLEAICEECHYVEHHKYAAKKQLNVEKW